MTLNPDYRKVKTTGDNNLESKSYRRLNDSRLISVSIGYFKSQIHLFFVSKLCSVTSLRCEDGVLSLTLASWP